MCIARHRVKINKISFNTACIENSILHNDNLRSQRRLSICLNELSFPVLEDFLPRGDHAREGRVQLQIRGATQAGQLAQAGAAGRPC